MAACWEVQENCVSVIKANAKHGQGLVDLAVAVLILVLPVVGEVSTPDTGLGHL